MIAKNCTVEQLEAAGNRCGIPINTNETDRGIRFTLRRSEYIAGKWQTANPISGRKAGTVCFHGHYAFLRELFAIAPDAIVRSDWYGTVVYDSANFREEAQEFGMQSLGFPGNIYEGYQIREKCLCLEDDPNPEGIY